MDTNGTPRMWPRLQHGNRGYHDAIDLIERQLFDPVLRDETSWFVQDKPFSRESVEMEDREWHDLDRALCWRDRFARLMLKNAIMESDGIPRIWPRLHPATSGYHDAIDLIERQLFDPGLWLHKRWFVEDHTFPYQRFEMEEHEWHDLENALCWRSRYGRMKFLEEEEAFLRNDVGEDGYNPYRYDPYDPSTWPMSEQIIWELSEQEAQ